MDKKEKLLELENELRDKIHKDIEEFYQAMQDNDCLKLIYHRHMCSYEFDKDINGYLYYQDKNYVENKCKEYLTSVGKKQDIDYSMCDYCPKMITVAWDENNEPLYIERM